MSSPVPAIQVDNLSYAYGRAEAVHGLSLTIPTGRCYGLFGRNGAGKTTTMKCLSICSGLAAAASACLGSILRNMKLR
jgi:ABC-2 type transport system ATP-binding protein